MYFAHSSVDKIQNGIDLSIDVSFGNYQAAIDKNAHFFGDGKYHS